MCFRTIKKYCDDYDLLPDYQYAYRRYYSCETSLLKLINNILWNMENKLVTAVIILDLSTTWIITYFWKYCTTNLE